MKNWIKHLFVAGLLTVGSSAAFAGTIKLDFERAADGTPMPGFGWVREEYAALGIVFTQGTVRQAAFFDGNAENHFLTSSSPLGYFVRPVFGISIESFSFWNATLSVFDAAGNLLASDRLVNETGQALRGLLSVTSATEIHSFSILPDVDGRILNLDNMSLIVGDEAAAVPEPTGLALLLAGFGAMGFLRRRRYNS